MSNIFKLLAASDIECRVAQAGVNKNGNAWASILLYKDARVDQRIMDETFGPMNWTCEYILIDNKMYCKVNVWDKEKNCWVSKMNVGTESNTECEKGQASDALKRACFTWGLGVELYSAPKNLFVNLNTDEYTVSGNSVKVKSSFKLVVDSIQYSEDRKIVGLVLKDKDGNERYCMGKTTAPVRHRSPDPASYGTQKPAYTPMDEKTFLQCIEGAAKGQLSKSGRPLKETWARITNAGPEELKMFENAVIEYKVNNNIQ